MVPASISALVFTPGRMLIMEPAASSFPVCASESTSLGSQAPTRVCHDPVDLLARQSDLRAHAFKLQPDLVCENSSQQHRQECSLKRNSVATTLANVHSAITTETLIRGSSRQSMPRYTTHVAHECLILKIARSHHSLVNIVVNIVCLVPWQSGIHTADTGHLDSDTDFLQSLHSELRGSCKFCNPKAFEDFRCPAPQSLHRISMPTFWLKSSCRRHGREAEGRTVCEPWRSSHPCSVKLSGF